MNMYQIHHILRQFRVSFRTFFNAITDQDFGIILAAPNETLLAILQDRYGYTRVQAKAAWNEFVMRYVDGNIPTDCSDLTLASGCPTCLASYKLIKPRCLSNRPRVQSKPAIYG